MKKVFVFFALLTTLSFTSCTPTSLNDDKFEQIDESSIDPPTEEAEEEIEEND